MSNSLQNATGTCGLITAYWIIYIIGEKISSPIITLKKCTASRKTVFCHNFFFFCEETNLLLSLTALVALYRGGQKFAGCAAIVLHGIAACELFPPFLTSLVNTVFVLYASFSGSPEKRIEILMYRTFLHSPSDSIYSDSIIVTMFGDVAFWVNIYNGYILGAQILN